MNTFKKTITATFAASLLAGALLGPASTFASAATKPVTSLTTTATLNNPSSNITVNPDASTITPASSNGEVGTNNLISNVIKKAITSALRYGGDYLGKLLSKLSPSAGNFVTKYSSKIADFLDSITNWQKNIIATGLVGIGIPPAEAYEIASAIVWLAGL
ncbi:hypothetical protein ABID47_004148 [Paenibacillus favisporus]|uniref:Uncharacterized protein n=1 Tax=Paenibacillus favisporus TaxID=221028 RepID=A0ABV2F6Y7_9BACL